jgi:hypothetical protein
MPDTRTAEITLSENGIVIVRIRAGARQSIADAQENLGTAIAQTGGRRCPVLIDIRFALPLAADVRTQYSGARVADAFSALAMVVEVSPLGRMMGNVYLSVACLAISTRLFHDERLALEWLQRQNA